MNDRANINLAKSQIGFIDFIVLPSFEVFVKFLPKVSKNVEQLKINRQKWSSLVASCKKLQDSGNGLIQKFKEIEEEEEKSSKKEVKQVTVDLHTSTKRLHQK